MENEKEKRDYDKVILALVTIQAVIAIFSFGLSSFDAENTLARYFGFAGVLIIAWMVWQFNKILKDK